MFIYQKLWLHTFLPEPPQLRIWERTKCNKVMLYDVLWYKSLLRLAWSRAIRGNHRLLACYNKNHQWAAQTSSAWLTASSPSDVAGGGESGYQYGCHRQEINVEVVRYLNIILSLQSLVHASKFPLKTHSWGSKCLIIYRPSLSSMT